MRNVEFYLIYVRLLWLKKWKQVVFCVYQLRSISTRTPRERKKARDTGHFIVGGKRKELEHTKPNMNRRAATYLLF